MHPVKKVSESFILYNAKLKWFIYISCTFSDSQTDTQHNTGSSIVHMMNGVLSLCMLQSGL